MAKVNIPCVAAFDNVVAESLDTSVGPKWEAWIKLFENYVLALSVSSDAQKRALLLHAVGPRCFEIFDSLPDTGTTYAHAKVALSNHFRPKVNIEYERAVFRRLRQKSDEKLDSYHTRLRKAAGTCNFQSIDQELKSHIIQTTTDSKLRKQGLKEDGLTLAEILQIGRSNELAQVQNSDLEKDLGLGLAQSHPENRVHAVSTKRQNSKNFRPNNKGNGNSARSGSVYGRKKCFGCGRSYPHPRGPKSCPAFGKKCHDCGRVNHFAKY
ncbi:uncharacterized protein LOC117113377 [Anneissia japonica]|uniref:uncharacterized protein LOC117113377 n=1 Tax=Anneissia japonica TaxID=1529436 RepID=UPI0014258CE7|nr:uncharacterized protein LOC117113377 [Anneissia japonica]